jgi:hypothetical protein
MDAENQIVRPEFSGVYRFSCKNKKRSLWGAGSVVCHQAAGSDFPVPGPQQREEGGWISENTPGFVYAA